MARLRRLTRVIVPAAATTGLRAVGSIANGMARAPRLSRLRPRVDSYQDRGLATLRPFALRLHLAFVSYYPRCRPLWL